MSWDFEFRNGDLTGRYVTGDDEVIQRMIARLERELGEWFLNTQSGLPWYQRGNGILGTNMRNKGIVDQLIRQRVLGTEGIARVVSMNTIFASATRQYSVYMKIVLDSGSTVEGTVSVNTNNNGVSVSWLQNNTA